MASVLLSEYVRVQRQLRDAMNALEALRGADVLDTRIEDGPKQDEAKDRANRVIDAYADSDKERQPG